MEFVGCGWGGDWFGEFGWVDGDGASRPLPVTLLVLRRRPAKSVTVTSLISTFFMFARKMPLAQVPEMGVGDQWNRKPA